MNALELISLADRFTVKKDGGNYTVDHDYAEVAAEISHDFKIYYYVTGAYNSGRGWLEINQHGFAELQEFCNLIVKQEDRK